MKARVITDSDGFLVGFHPLDMSKPQGENAPASATILPHSGQLIYEMEISDATLKQLRDKSLRHFRVQNNKLIETDTGIDRPNKK